MEKIASEKRTVTRIADQLPESYLREAEEAFGRAVSNAGGTRDFIFVLAGLRICLTFAGDILLPRITATLAHLEAPGDAPADFTIYLWDDKATASEMPMPTRWMRNQITYCCVNILTNSRFRTFDIEWMGILCCMDMKANVAYCCYADAEHLLMYEISAPLRSVFGTILNRQGMQLVHASAVGTAEGTLLFAGPPGSGKSTLAILSLLDGLSYQSDDICVLTADKQPISHCIYNIAKLREDVVPLFESLHPVLSYFQEDKERKGFFYVHRHFPSQVLKEAPVRALVLPRIVDEPSSRLERATPLEAIRGLIQWTIREIPRSDNLGEKIMLQSIARLPAYRLHLGRDNRQTLALIRTLL